MCLCRCRCTFTYHKSTDAPLWRVPFEAAVDVAACVDQEHDAASNSVEVAQKQLQKRQTGEWFTQMKPNGCATAKKEAGCYLHNLSLSCGNCICNTPKMQMGDNAMSDRCHS